MQITLGIVEDMFKRHQWRYEIGEGHLITAFENVPMAIGVDTESNIVLLEVPIVAGAGMQGYQEASTGDIANTCVYMCAANYKLALGNFARDHTDGEIRYESNLSLAGSILTDQQLWSMIEVAHAAVTVYAPTITGILCGRTSLTQALSELNEADQ